MREFIPSDYIDKEGNVYETVGENIREGKNGSVTSDFPTPEEIGNGLVGSDGENYITVLKNISNIPFKNEYLAPTIDNNGFIVWGVVNKVISDSTKSSYAPIATKGVSEYVETKTIIPTGFKKYAVSFTYDGSTITITNTDNIPNLEVKVIGDHFVVKSSLGISFIEIAKFTPVTPEVVILDTQIYFDEMKLSARINTNKTGTYELLLIAG